MQLDVLYNAANFAWPELRDGVLAAEADGFGTAWVYDHMSGSVFGSPRMLECFSLAGALAAATSRIGIGTLVVNAANRTPGMTVSAAASIQEISAGRLVFGLGAGAAPGTKWAEEQDLLGIPLPATMAARHARLVETLDLCDTLWAPDRDAKWAGFPLPAARPPIMLGVNSTSLAALAGRRCDGVNVRFGHPDTAAIFDAALAARAASLRPGRPFTLSVWAGWSDAVLDPDGEIQGSLRSLGVDRLIAVR